MSSDPVDPAPDTKDWTWVLERTCPECGYDARSVRPAEVKTRVDANARAWERVLEGPRVRVRQRAGAWSTLECACHVRDVHRIFGARVRLLLALDDPLFDDWDQDRAAAEGEYAAQDPATVSAELLDAAANLTELYGSVIDAQWDRPGRRSNGSPFTIASLARYHLHDVEHHLHDVAG